MKSVIINSLIVSKDYKSDNSLKTIFGTQVSSYTLGDQIKIIGAYAFYGCKDLASINLPISLTSIEHDAFSECTGLKALTIPNSVKNIGKKAFRQCIMLEQISIPNSLTAIEDEVFSSCSCLTNIDIPNSVTKIGWGSFRGTGLTSIIIPNSVKDLGGYAFAGCSELETVVITNTLTIIPSFSFANCTSLRSINIPSSVTAINMYAFRDCKSLSNIELPSKLENIEQNAFEGCENLTSIVFPGSVKKIGWKAFVGTSITNVKFMHSKENMDKLNWDSPDTSDFKGPSETTLLFSDDVTSKVGRSYFRFRSDAFKYWIEDNPVCFVGIDKEGYAEGTFVKVIDGDCYQWITINGSVDGKTFTPSSYCIDSNTSGKLDLSSINSYSNGEGTSYTLKDIVFEAFRGRAKLTAVNIPNTVKALGGSSFRATGLRRVVVPNSVTTLGMDVFRECKHLKTVVLGNSVKSLDEAVFNFDDSLEIVVSLTKMPPVLDESTFGSIHDFDHDMTLKGHTYAIIVHNDALKAYQNAEYWKDFTNYQTFESTPVYLIADTLNLKGSSARILFYPIDEAHNYGEISNGEELVINGLEPETSTSGMKIDWVTKDGNFGTAILNVATSAFSFETKDAKALSTTKARLIASTDEYDDMTHYGFEWKRYDAPEDLPANKVTAPLYNGQIVGTLKKLKDDVYYKYRPFYTSDSGKTYYGDWKTFFTGDADVYFEPEVYTKDAADITKVSALLVGLWIEGTEDIEEKGFEYWTLSGNNTRAAGGDVQTVVVSGNKMTATIEGLKPGATYVFRAYAKTVSDITYGEEKTFKTILIGDVDGDGELTYADVKAIADYILGKNPENFNVKMADANEDGYVNTADIVKIISIIKASQQ